MFNCSNTEDLIVINAKNIQTINKLTHFLLKNVDANIWFTDPISVIWLIYTIFLYFDLVFVIITDYEYKYRLNYWKNLNELRTIYEKICGQLVKSTYGGIEILFNLGKVWYVACACNSSLFFNL